MTDSVDNKVVSMKFDNAAFESKLGDTLKSLDKLQKSLDFQHSTRGLNELSAASRGFSLHGVTDAIEGVGAKFLAMSTIGITALATITTHAVQAGARILSAFTFDPIRQGFQEFENNIGSIQTILANTSSKGTDLEDVNKALDTLNQYADQTIYNFSQMTKNIGTFTAAGVELDKSVLSIKGIANLAAISGSNAEQASNAMYQLSQAIAAGSVKLMDWNSIVNAGMGGEVFQKALFETGKAMGTIKTNAKEAKEEMLFFEGGWKPISEWNKNTPIPDDIPRKLGMDKAGGAVVTQTFEEWKKAGNTFRGSLESGWLTAEVLTKTLAGFTGDLTEAQLMSMGYNKAQAAEMVRLGKLGKAAATEVKTFTQLMSTVKEAIGSGWSTTFRTLVGDFEESKTLFTNISNAIGGFVGKQADARNELLKGWKDLGGRTLLIEAFGNALKGIGSVLKPIGQAFREMFPRKTAEQLFEYTQIFLNFSRTLTVSGGTADKIKRIFLGLFAAFKTAKTVLFGVIGLFHEITKHFEGVGGAAFDFAARVGDALVRMNTAVENGALVPFFGALSRFIQEPIKYIEQLDEKLLGLFSDKPGLPKLEGGLGRLIDKAKEARGAADRLSQAWERISNVFEGIGRVLDAAWEHLKTWFSELGQKLADVMKPGDFDAAVDIINIGLLGGIILMLKKFMSGGFLSGLTGGLADKVGGVLDALTNKLQAMQANVRAETLLKIAAAVGILTASVLVLSLIDSAALTKALTAMAVGMGQLIGAMAILSQSASLKGAASVVIISTAMNLMASAILILSGAMKVLGTMSWDEIGRGLTAITALIGGLVGAANLLTKVGPTIILAGAAMIGMATGIVILAGAVKLFADMKFGDMMKGLYGVTLALGIVTALMNAMNPLAILATGVAMIPLATGITILAGAVKVFATMSWGEIGKGMVALAGTMLILAVAMNAMPPWLPIIAVGLIGVGVALGIISGVMAILGNMDMGTIAKSIGALAAMLIVLAAGVTGMTAAVVGAPVLLVVAAALVVLSKVLISLSGLSLKELAIGLGAIAAVLALLGIAALVLQPVIPALFGLGVALGLIGASFALFGAGAMLVAKAFELMGRAGKAGAEGIVAALKVLISMGPEIFKHLAKVLVDFVAEILNAAPVLIKGITVILGHLLDTIIELVPKIAEALIVIITEGLRLIREKGPDLVATGAFIIIELLKGINENISQITQLAIEIIIKFAKQLTANAHRLVDAAIDLLTAFIDAVAKDLHRIIESGSNLLAQFLLGIANHMANIAATVTEIVTIFIDEVAKNSVKIASAGADALITLLKGIKDNMQKIVDTAVDVIIEFTWALGQQAIWLIRAGFDLLITFLNGLAQAIREKSGELRQAGINIASAILSGITFGLSDKAGGALNAVGGFFDKLIQKGRDVLESESPSKVFMRMGEDILAGLIMAFGNDREVQRDVVAVAENIVKSFEKTLSKAPELLAGMDEFNPTITPVLDLTKVQSAAKGIDGMMTSAITPEVSFNNARHISASTIEAQQSSDESTSPVVTREIKFEQNNYSPKALSTGDIYRNTRSQITLAKEELNIP